MTIIESKNTIMTKQVVELEGVNVTFDYTQVSDVTVPETPVTTGPAVIAFNYAEVADVQAYPMDESLTRLNGSYNAAGNFTFNLSGSKSVFDLMNLIIAVQAYAKSVMVAFLTPAP